MSALRALVAGQVIDQAAVEAVALPFLFVYLVVLRDDLSALMTMAHYHRRPSSPKSRRPSSRIGRSRTLIDSSFFVSALIFAMNRAISAFSMSSSL